MKNCFVCMTTFQYSVAEKLAGQLFEKYNEKSVVIQKYIDKSNGNNSTYLKRIKIPNDIVGKLIVAFISKIPFGANLFWSMTIGEIECFCYFNDRDPITKALYRLAKNKKIKTILVEEGLGTYFKSVNPALIGETCPPDAAIIAYPALYKKYHTQETNLIELNYSSLFNEHLELDKKTQKNDILFLGQSTPQHEGLRDYELMFIKELLVSFPEKRIILKPHPRDVHFQKYFLDKRRVSVIPEKLILTPVEEIIDQFDIEIVASLFSSGCVSIATMNPNLKIIFGFALYKIPEKYNLQSLLEVSNYIRNVYIPRTQEDIEAFNKQCFKKHINRTETNMDLTIFT